MYLHKMLAPILIFLSVFTTIVYGQVETKIVHINQGPIRGYKDAKLDVFAFRGVPYAMEPKGKDKFKAPLPPPKWAKIFDAANSNKCPQQFLSSLISIPDNCLVANIYVPTTNATNLPVLIFIHGGGYLSGYGDGIQPKSLVNSKKIIAVTINYRLGAHGFLCLGTESAPGNAGLKDQVAGIRWVKENIARFGGNPNDITIAGSSAGSASVNLHLLSKMTRGLFQKLIPDSSSEIAPYSVQQDPIEDAKQFARRVSEKVDINHLKSLEEFYEDTPITTLIKTTGLISESFSIMFGPCVEKDIGVERYLDASPYSILKSGDFPKLPKLEGFANMEGLIKLPNFLSYIPKMNKDFSDFLPADLKFESKEQKDEVAKTIKQFYFGDKNVGLTTALEYMEYFSDAGFVYSILRSIKMHLEAGSETYYLYEYAFVDDNTPNIPFTNVTAANHSAQTSAVYDAPLSEIFFPDSKPFAQMKTTMRELWLNFITDGQPTLPSTQSVPAWPKVEKFNSPYMLLDRTSSVKTSLAQARFDLWDQIYEKYYSEPKPPCHECHFQ